MAASMHQKQIPGQPEPEALEGRQKFAAILRKRLEELGWNQLMLADKMDVNSSTVSRWLQGTAVPTFNDFYRLAKVIKLPVQTLLCGIAPETVNLINSMTPEKLALIKFTFNIYDQGVDLRTLTPGGARPATFTPPQQNLINSIR